MCFVALIDNRTQLFLVAKEVNFQGIRVNISVNKAEILRNLLVVDESSHSGFNQMSSLVIFAKVHSNLYLSVDINDFILICHQHFIKVSKYFAVALFRYTLKACGLVRFRSFSVVKFVFIIGNLFLAVNDFNLFAGARIGQIVRTQNHILCRRSDWGTILRRQNVIDG